MNKGKDVLQSHRNEQGYNIYKAGGVDRINETKFIVESQTEKNKYYEVELVASDFCCNCPDYEKRSSWLDCKHIMAARHYLAAYAMRKQAFI